MNTSKIILSFLFSGLFSLTVFAQTTTFTASSGDWSNASNWSNGVPTSSVDAIIGLDNSCNVDLSNAICRSLTLNGGNGNTLITIPSGKSLTVVNSASISAPTTGNRINRIYVDGSFTAASVTMSNTSNNNRDCVFEIAAGTATISGNITMNGSAQRNSITFSSSGTLQIAGTITGGTITSNSNGTVHFNHAGNQSIPGYTYHNVSISGIGTKSLSGALVVNNLTNTSSLSIGSNTLTINGSISGSGTISGSSTSSMVINATNSLNLNQSSSSTRTLQNLTFNASSGTLTIANPVEIVGTLTPTAGTILSNGNITIVSNGSVEGRIGVTGAGASVSGNVVVQKFIPSGNRRWLHIGSPIQNFTWNQLIDDILISGPGAGGFDVNGSNFPSAFIYEEDYDGDCGPNGWEFPTNVSNSVPVSRGIKIFFRGDRNPDRLNFNGPAPNAVTLDFVGVVNSGSINMPVTYTNHGVDNWDGWNFIPNPYPSPIDWNAPSGWTRNRMGNTIYVWNAAAGTYATWNGNSGTNGMSNGRIAMGQGFWVKANQGGGNPTLTMNENVKVGTATPGFFKTDEAITSTFRLRMVQDSIVFDDVVFNFDAAFDRSYQRETGDALKLVNSSINIWSVSSDNENLVINNYPTPQTTDTVVLGMTSSTGGIFTLQFSTDSIPSNILVYLIDEFRGRVIDVRKEKSWRVLINADPKSYAIGRLKLVFSNIGNTVWSASANAESALKQTRINWNSNQEVYTTKYEVQHSTDSIQFNTIHTVLLNDTLLLNPTSYSFLHLDPAYGVNYYRVARYGVKGSIEYSQVQKVQFTAAPTGSANLESEIYRIFPVPAVNELHITTFDTKQVQSIDQVNIMTISGQEVTGYTYTQNKNTITLNIYGLPAGNYIINLINRDGKVSNIKFIKK